MGVVSLDNEPETTREKSARITGLIRTFNRKTSAAQNIADVKSSCSCCETNLNLSQWNTRSRERQIYISTLRSSRNFNFFCKMFCRKCDDERILSVSPFSRLWRWVASQSFLREVCSTRNLSTLKSQRTTQLTSDRTSCKFNELPHKIADLKSLQENFC